jgi:hypothetical protein
MQINSLEDKYGAGSFYTADYRVWHDSFKPHLNQAGEKVLVVTAAIAYKYQGDFYGLLDHLNIPKHYHYYILVHNGYRHAGDYLGEDTEVRVPDLSKIEMLSSLYNSAAKHF